ncbi:L-rhamnose mutarotase [Algoriphagus sp. C2-6-M1]|uniref:L-rhamnose mutarotase n=1 Tax=Algoriphagus persicinus TaxID=3108754 RepID=UPI002B3785E3|nr:L-rhamnose mutarotase [Algoriphagus sp. C2-6-M1]MEB2780088.1 L-rhamnose mutarotase [Algoriphagus sp. C2-6-M1]
MPRKLAFRLKLIPGFEEEYERRHREIWPELVTLLKDTGIIDYQIFLDRETSCLFAYQVIDGNANSQELGGTEIVQRWWKNMADIMETNPDNSPISVELSNVFNLQ